MSNFVPIISLIRPQLFVGKSSYSFPITPPLALAILAGTLKAHDINFQIIDSIGLGPDCYSDAGFSVFRIGISDDEIIDLIHPESKYVGISSMFSTDWPFNRELIKKIKKKYPNKKIIIGGEHATAFYDELKYEKYIDIIIRGEGEKQLIDLLLNNKIIENDFHDSRLKKEELTFPCWDYIPLENYFKNKSTYGVYLGRSLPMLASRGCPYKCTFCSSPQMYGNKYIIRNLESVFSEIDIHIQKFNIEHFEFYDLTAIVRKSWIIDFCKYYIENNYKFSWSLPSGTRSEALDEEVLKLLKKSNCKYLAYAPESGSVKILKEIKKKVCLKKMTKSIRTAVKLKISTRCNIMVGFPGETRLDLAKTFFFQVKLALIGVEDLPIYFFSPYPGSELFNKLVNEKKIVINDEYFHDLRSQMGIFKCKNFNNNISNIEYAAFRLFAMIFNYIILYVFHPKLIYRTTKNIFNEKFTESVTEQRLKSITTAWSMLLKDKLKS